MINLMSKYILGAFILCTMINCTRMDHTYADFLEGGEKVYSAKPRKIGLFAGNERIKMRIALVSAPNVEKVAVYWNNRNDSVAWEVEGVATGDTTFVEGIINDIAEGRHSFEFVTFDQKGNASIKVDTVGVVYGEEYRSTLINRSVESAKFSKEGMVITWLDAPYETAIGGQIQYINSSGVARTVDVPLEELVTKISERPLGDSIRIRTAYIPDDRAIDTFYTFFQAILVEIPGPEVLDKSKFQTILLPGDAPKYPIPDINPDNIWDDDLAGNSWYGTADSSGHPHWYTIDLGVTVQLTEYTIWQRGVISELGLVYAHANMKKWEIWGSNDPDPDGGWENWDKLVESESFKPSGLPFGEVTEEDYEYARNGDTFTFIPDASPVRYIRMKVFETWDPGKSHRSFLQEISFTGIVE